MTDRERCANNMFNACYTVLENIERIKDGEKSANVAMAINTLYFMGVELGIVKAPEK